MGLYVGVLVRLAVCLLLSVQTLGNKFEKDVCPSHPKSICLTAPTTFSNTFRRALSSYSLTMTRYVRGLVKSSQPICAELHFRPTSERSSFTFEMWLPVRWSGRLLGTGNGGIDGCLYCFSTLKVAQDTTDGSS